MKAVNLIPREARRGGETSSRPSGGVYALLGVLAALVLAVGAYVLTSNSVKDNRAKLVDLEAKAARTQAEANRLRAYYDFAQMREKRVATVSALASSRFDWERGMRQLARVIPDNIFLVKFVGTVQPGVTVDSMSVNDPAAVRANVQAPAFQLVGCTDNQADVAVMMSRLRRMTGVTRVTLSLSEKPDAKDTATATELNTKDLDCRFDYSIPRFTVTVFFRPLQGAQAGAAPVGAAPPAAPAGQPGAAPGATPAANTGGTK